MTDFSNIPEGEHYAIVESLSINVLDWGGINKKQEVTTYHAYSLDEHDKWFTEIERRSKSLLLDKFRALHVRPVNVAVEVIVSIDVSSFK